MMMVLSVVSLYSAICAMRNADVVLSVGEDVSDFCLAVLGSVVTVPSPYQGPFTSFFIRPALSVGGRCFCVTFSCDRMIPPLPMSVLGFALITGWAMEGS